MATESSGISSTQYNSILKDISKIYEQSLNDGNEDWNKAVLSSNWKIGQRIIEVTQEKKTRAAYGDKVLNQLSKDSSAVGERPSDGWKLENTQKVFLKETLAISENSISITSQVSFIPNYRGVIMFVFYSSKMKLLDLLSKRTQFKRN